MSLEQQTIENNLSVVRRYFEEVWNRGQVELLDQLLHPAYCNHSVGSPDQDRGRQGVKSIVRAIRQAFPDLHYTIEDLVASPDAVAARVTLTGTHQGPFFGRAPTGRKVRVAQINIERFREGRIAEHWRLTDLAEMERQLGAG